MPTIPDPSQVTHPPRRIQRKRTKGWRMPEGAVYVGRPSRWGNPFVVRRGVGFAGMPGVWFVSRGDKTWVPEVDSEAAAKELAVKVYRGEVGGFWNRFFREAIQRELRGKDLACWCPLGQPCHADVLLDLANQGVS